tara:strand:+ start:383 stop:619 length:237 start_codon:yes stop_codon:yes gene_type:complete
MATTVVDYQQGQPADVPSPTLVRSNALASVWMLAWREWIRFFRQRNRVIGALGQPILFWLLFGGSSSHRRCRLRILVP